MKGSRAKSKDRTGPLEAPTLEAVVKYINDHKVQKVIVMAGAGISTAAGIPDFRSKGTGLYDNLKKFNLPYAEAIFDIDYFEEKPEPFYALAKELYPGQFFPTKTHYFVRLLHEKNKLHRIFTQNIDTLERLSGLPADAIVEAHGSFATASCIKCNVVADPEEVHTRARNAQVAYCQEVGCKGLVKPNITFFGQNLPKRFFERLPDFDDADLLIVIGTSLQVQPFASLIDNVADHVPRLLINKERAGDHNSSHHGFDFRWKYKKKRDVCVLGDCDAQVEKLADLLGWKDDLQALYTKGHAQLKASWAAAKEAKEDEEPSTLSVASAADAEIDALAKELEEKLHLPAEQNKKDETNS